jgi:hypothetical protein
MKMKSAATIRRYARAWTSGVVASQVRALGYGGIAAVARATGIAPSTIGRGLKELDQVGGMGLSGISCSAGRFDYQAFIAFVKRSPKITAICALAAVHSRGGIFQSFSARFKTRKRSFRAASSLGKWIASVKVV